jgi:hypothetical protein
VSPAGLSPIQALRGRKVFKILVIGEQTDWMSSTIEITSPFLERRYYCEHFLVMDFVVNFRFVYRSRGLSNSVQSSILFIFLFIDYTPCSPKAMASEVQTNNLEQEQQLKPNKGKSRNLWPGSTTPHSPVTPALVTKKFSRNPSSL